MNGFAGIYLLPSVLIVTFPQSPLPPPPSSHPSDEKDHSFPRNISASSLGSLMSHYHSTNHIPPAEPSITDPLMSGSASGSENDTRVNIEKNEVCRPPNTTYCLNLHHACVKGTRSIGVEWLDSSSPISLSSDDLQIYSVWSWLEFA